MPALRALLVGGLGALLFLHLASAAGDEVSQGEYVFHAAGCAACHTDKKRGGAPLAGGRALKTDFGTFYSPNITPDPTHGIGRWSAEDFRGALRLGVSPGGGPYFPAFPYTSFTKMADPDIQALWSYLRTVPPAPRANTPHDLRAPFSWRFLVHVWKWLYFEPGPFRSDPSATPQLNRGRYLVEALGHCGECHTPRNRLGAMKKELYLAGTQTGPEGQAIPNITPDPKTGLGRWSTADIVQLLEIGMTRDGDFVGDGMAEVVDESTGRLTAADRLAIATYLKAVPPIRNLVERKKERSKSRQPEW